MKESKETPLRGCKAMAGYYFGDEAKWRKINRLCKSGRFPHYREGTIMCSYASVIERWRQLQLMYAMCGRPWGPKDVFEHFGDCTKPFPPSSPSDGNTDV